MSATFLSPSDGKIQVKATSGRFTRIRVSAMACLVGGYYLLPWLSVNERPALLLDLAARRFYILGQTFVPQDIIYLSVLLILSAVGLFFVTTLAGRVFCGYACPQTVWTELFMWIEHFIEGDRAKRLRLDKQPWNVEKALRRGGKHLVWLLVAAVTGLTFVSYFVPPETLFRDLLQGQLGGWAIFWAVFYSVATWGNAGFLREQVCKYMCPYARFQSVMFDQDTLLIGYDAKRGEPRKGAGSKDAGDCINCTLCVQVCPTGIDIRDGLQYECIACAACVDVCDDVMQKVGKPTGLVRYSTANLDDGQTTRIVRPKSLAYGAVFALLVAAFISALWVRSPFEMDVYRDRTQLYWISEFGELSNRYDLHVTNKQQEASRLRVAVRPAKVFSVSPNALYLAPWQSKHQSVSVKQRGRASLKDIEILLIDHEGQVVAEQDARFIGERP